MRNDSGAAKAPSRNGYFTATLAKGLDVLEALSALDEAGLTELARRTGVAGPTLFRILATLAEKGYVEKSAKTYRPTLKAWEVGTQIVRRLGLKDIARDRIEALVREVRESAHIAVLQGHDVVIVEKIDCEQPVRVDTFVGQRAPAHCSAIGKAILAFAAEPKRARVLAAPLERHTAGTIVGRARLERELDLVRRRGWAENREEWRLGVSAIAVPIRDHADSVVAALSLTMPSARFTDVERRFAPPLLKAGAQISRELARRR